MKKVLIAIDNSALSEKILITGSEMASPAGAACAVISVIAVISSEVYLPDGGFPIPVVSTADLFESGKKTALSFINDVINRNKLNIAEIIIKQGDAAEEIINTAAETGSDTIVIGTHGRTGLDHLLMGSVHNMLSGIRPCQFM